MRMIPYQNFHSNLNTAFMKFRPVYLILLLLTLTQCDGFFGTQTDTEFLDVPTENDRDIAYVPVLPILDGLSRPVDVVAGWDELIYVADAGAEEIISYDQAGNELGRFPVPGLTAISQDRRLDILAVGTSDTIINNATLSLATIYRIDLNKQGNYGLNEARISRKLVHPFYFKTGTPSSSDSEVRFNGIAPLANNQYYVTRTGPSNDPRQFGGPDDAVIRFTEEDLYRGPIFITTSLGIFLNYFNRPQGITTRATPPQSPAVDLNIDFAFTSLSEDNAIKVQIIREGVRDMIPVFELTPLETGDTSRADRFLYDPDRFDRPFDITIAGDRTNYIFVVDQAKDSLYQFNGLGYEGISAPAGSSSDKVVPVSIGGTGDGLTQFREPSGVAYLDQIVYVADAGNGRVLRFKLTTDFD